MPEFLEEDFDFSWRSLALCKGMHVNDFFPERINQSNRQKYNTLCQMCSECPVETQCFYEAMIFEYDGLWAGTLMKERANWRDEISDSEVELTYDLCAEFLYIKKSI